MPNAGSTPLPTIRLILVTATLTSQGRDRMDLIRYHPGKSGKQRMSGNELLAAMPEITAFARVEVDTDNPYEAATTLDLCRLGRRVGAALADPAIAGVVVVHGTNSLEETAFFLHLTAHSEKPIVVTGAQRPFTALSTDGPMNLLDAFRVVTSAEAAGAGVLVVANNEIHSARDVTKTNTYRLHTFQSRGLGPLGTADTDRLTFHRRITRRAHRRQRIAGAGRGRSAARGHPLCACRRARRHRGRGGRARRARHRGGGHRRRRYRRIPPRIWRRSPARGEPWWCAPLASAKGGWRLTTTGRNPAWWRPMACPRTSRRCCWRSR